MPSSLARVILVLLISHGEGFRHCHGDAISSWLAQGFYFVLFGGYGESIRVNHGLDHQQCSIGSRMMCPSLAVSSCQGLKQHRPDDKCENYYERKLEYFTWAYPCVNTAQNFSVSKATPKRAGISSWLCSGPTKSTPRPDTWCMPAGDSCALPPEDSQIAVSSIKRDAMATFDVLKQVFERSVVPKKTRDRVGSVPQGYEVMDIYSIKNSDAMQDRYNKYKTDVKLLIDCWNSNDSIQAEWFDGDGERLGYMKSRTEPAEPAEPPEAPLTSKILQSESARLPNDQLVAAGLILNPEVNEALLIHGTDVQNIPQIVTKGLKVDFGKDGKLFGKGLYFAETSSKADEYSRAHAEFELESTHTCCGIAMTRRTVEDVGTDLHYAFLAKVVLGNAYPDPEAQPLCYHMSTSDAGEEIAKKRCHSVIGYRVFREFVVYDDGAAQLGWVIKYKKK